MILSLLTIAVLLMGALPFAAALMLPGLARAAGLRVLIVNAGHPGEAAGLRDAGFLQVMTGGFGAAIDLTRPQAERRAALQGKWRNRLVRAEASGLEVRAARYHAGRHGWLIEAEVAQRRARGYRGLPPGLAALAAQADPGAVRVFEAVAQGRVIAAMLFLIHGAAATYFIGHAGAEGRAAAAHNLLLWQASNRLAAAGVARLDLGPVETERAPGLARFKLGAGAEAKERGGSWLWTPATAPLAQLSRRAARGFRWRSDPSCR